MQHIHYQGDIQPDGTLSPFRVAVRDGIDGEGRRSLERSRQISLVDDPVTAQGMMIRSATRFLFSEDFERSKQLMYLVRVGVGMDTINVQAASSAGVATVSTPGASTRPVAQRAVTFMLNWAARTAAGTKALSEHRWPKGEQSVQPIDLSDKTLGIIGYGRIGRETKRLAEPYVRRVIFTDVRDISGSVDLDTLLREADVVSIHVAGSEEILTAERLSLLKTGGLLVNTARGEVVNTAALLKRMDEGVSAALDVFPREGQAMFDDPAIARIVRHPHFIGTPHTAASDVVTQQRLGREGAERMIEFAERGVVNPHGVPGHTLPRIVASTVSSPGIRLILTHRSIAGSLAAITGIIAALGVNIRELINGEGERDNGHKLAMTVVDLDCERSSVALSIVQAIEREMTPKRKRLLSFGELPSEAGRARPPSDAASARARIAQ